MSNVLITTTTRNLEDLTLDEIMALSEPQRTDMLEKWLTPDLSVQDEGATLKAFNKDGKVINWKVKLADGTEVNFGPRGRNFSRKFALSLLTRYGKQGRYYGMHQPTGLRKRADMAQWTQIQKEDWDGKAEINLNYLAHVPQRSDGDGGSENLSGSQALS